MNVGWSLSVISYIPLVAFLFAEALLTVSSSPVGGGTIKYRLMAPHRSSHPASGLYVCVFQSYGSVFYLLRVFSIWGGGVYFIGRAACVSFVGWLAWWAASSSCSSSWSLRSRSRSCKSSRSYGGSCGTCGQPTLESLRMWKLWASIGRMRWWAHEKLQWALVGKWKGITTSSGPTTMAKSELEKGFTGKKWEMWWKQFGINLLVKEFQQKEIAWKIGKQILAIFPVFQRGCFAAISLTDQFQLSVSWVWSALSSTMQKTKLAQRL